MGSIRCRLRGWSRIGPGHGDSHTLGKNSYGEPRGNVWWKTSAPGQSVRLAWQQNSQNFVIAGGRAPAGGAGVVPRGPPGALENLGTTPFRVGSGCCQGGCVRPTRWRLPLGTSPRRWRRMDRAIRHGEGMWGHGQWLWVVVQLESAGGRGACGRGLCGWGGSGRRPRCGVTTLGEEFVRGVEGECVVEDFPSPGEAVTLEWQQNSQNFVVTDVE